MLCILISLFDAHQQESFFSSFLKSARHQISTIEYNLIFIFAFSAESDFSIFPRLNEF